jgi:enoyl-CoA hydratase
MATRREQRDQITIVHLEHGKANVFDPELCAALESDANALADEPSGAVVVTGAGRIFSAGVDLLRLQSFDRSEMAAFVDGLARAFRAWFVLPRPVIAAVNGHAIAGGGILAALADHVVMVDDGARIGIPELLVGVPFPTVGLEIVRHAVGDPAARRLILHGETLVPEDALAMGLVHELAPREAVLERALIAAGKLAAIPAGTFAITKRQLRRSALAAIDGAALDAEIAELWDGQPARSAIAAYAERTLGRR